VVSLIVSIVFAALWYILSPIVIRLMGAKGLLAELSIIYLKITFLDMPFTYMFFVVNSIMNAQGNMVIPTILSGISAVLNIVLDPVFIFTFNMGIAGAAIATLISKAILAFSGFYILMKSPTFIKPEFSKFNFNKKIIRKVFKVGLPASVGQSGAAVGFIVLNSFIASYGTSTIAAFGMVNRITALIMQPAMGVGAALTSIIGQNIGSNQINRAKEAFNKSIYLTVSFSVIGCIILLWKDKPVINFFMQSKDDITVISQGITYLRYITVSMPLMGIFSVIQGFFQGTGHTKYSMAMEIGRLWFIRLPMILFFKYFTSIGSTGIWFSMSFSNLLVCVYGYVIYRKGLWQYNIIRT
jgi:putative MATE family efflux protein